MLHHQEPDDARLWQGMAKDYTPDIAYALNERPRLYPELFMLSTECRIFHAATDLLGAAGKEGSVSEGLEWFVGFPRGITTNEFDVVPVPEEEQEIVRGFLRTYRTYKQSGVEPIGIGDLAELTMHAMYATNALAREQ
jgi:hypothetical protein